MIWVCGNNDITLVVKYDAVTITAKTNFSFIKEGDPGTNGTEYVCKIVPNVRENGSLSDYPMILLPLSFTLYDSSGTVVTEEELKKAEITWSVPIVDTMLKLTDVVIPTEQTESEAIYKNIAQLNYLIKDNFDMSLRQ